MAGYDGDQHESIKSPRVRESFGLCIGELLFERGSDDVQFRPSLSKCKTWPQSANFCKEKNRAVAQGIPLLGRQNLFRHHGGDPDIGAKNRVHAFKAFGADTDDGERGVVELDGSPEDVLTGKEEPAHERVEVERIEVIGSHDSHKNSVRLCGIGHGDRHGIRVSCQAAEGMSSFSEILDIREGHEFEFVRLRGHFCLRCIDGDRCGGILHGKWIQEKSVDDGEDGGVCANPTARVNAATAVRPGALRSKGAA